jgi:tetraacyldisaccharide 4'-kinase
MVTRCDLAGPERIAAISAEVRRRAPQADIVETTHRPNEWVNASRRGAALESMRGRPVAAFCGLGNPEAFRRTLTGLGLDVMAWRTFADHHGYTRQDIDNLGAWARELPAGTAVATTQKDLVKIRQDTLADKELWALKIQLHVRCGREALERRLSLVIGH